MPTTVTFVTVVGILLQIELGRYNKIAKEDRLCSWCKLVLGVETIEDEQHFLQYCNLEAVMSVRNMVCNVRFRFHINPLPL